MLVLLNQLIEDLIEDIEKNGILKGALFVFFFLSVTKKKIKNGPSVHMQRVSIYHKWESVLSVSIHPSTK